MSNVPKQKEAGRKDGITEVHTHVFMPMECYCCLNLQTETSPVCLLLQACPSLSDLHLLFTCSVSLSPQCKSSMNWPVNILWGIQVIRPSHIRKQGWDVSVLICVQSSLRSCACQGSCVQCRNFLTKESRCRLSPCWLPVPFIYAALWDHEQSSSRMKFTLSKNADYNFIQWHIVLLFF